jgi:HEAT repeat protein
MLQMSNAHEQPDVLVARIAAARSYTASSGPANDLLRILQAGHPVEAIIPLLQDENDEVVKTGSWIASELGRRGAPLLPHVVPLLRHPDKTVRFFALDCVPLWATPSRSSELAALLPLLSDEESAVRWKAMMVLASVSPEQLSAALDHLVRRDGHRDQRSNLHWLVSEDGQDAAQIAARLDDDDPLARRYTAVAAARLANVDAGPLRTAIAHPDPEVADFAASFRDRLQRFR